MFYKWDGTQLHETTSVYAPDFTLTEENHGEHVYPQGGWHWFDSIDAAKSHFSLPQSAPDGSDLAAYAAHKRWQVEVGGMIFNGINVPTDDRAKLLILGTAMTMAEDATAPFIISGVNYGMLSGAQFKAVNVAVVAHVRSTFPALASVLAAIEGGTIMTAEQVDAAFS